MIGEQSKGLWAMVPVKPFTLAKGRLSSVLSPSQRARLAQAMLHDVLNVLAQIDDLAGILIVTSDPDAAKLVSAYGALVCHDPYDAGTNCAVRQGLRVLREQGRGAVMVVHGDVPFLNANEIASVLARLRTSAMVIAPALRDGGVNLLAARLPSPIEPCFGSNSFVRHLNAARAAGVEPAILRLDGIGFDIDRAEDLAECADAVPATRTGALLAEFQKPASPPASSFIASPC
jgi:2-phospho-L-lactate guanylyltransferase